MAVAVLFFHVAAATAQAASMAPAGRIAAECDSNALLQTSVASISSADDSVLAPGRKSGAGDAQEWLLGIARSLGDAAAGVRSIVDRCWPFGHKAKMDEEKLVEAVTAIGEKMTEEEASGGDGKGGGKEKEEEEERKKASGGDGKGGGKEKEEEEERKKEAEGRMRKALRIVYHAAKYQVSNDLFVDCKPSATCEDQKTANFFDFGCKLSFTKTSGRDIFTAALKKVLKDPDPVSFCKIAVGKFGGLLLDNETRAANLKQYDEDAFAYFVSCCRRPDVVPKMMQ